MTITFIVLIYEILLNFRIVKDLYLFYPQSYSFLFFKKHPDVNQFAIKMNIFKAHLLKKILL